MGLFAVKSVIVEMDQTLQFLIYLKVLYPADFGMVLLAKYRNVKKGL